jgi:Membrane bound O-acyl transferase family
MFLYITSTFLTLKIVVAHNHLEKEKSLNFLQWCVFCYCWFGMNPRPFTSFPAAPLPGYGSYIKKGVSRIIFGMILIQIANYILSQVPGNQYHFIVHLLYLVALSLILHFGMLNISTGMLRRMGINVTGLFKDPIKSKSLQEFWSKRWNIAFVELTTIAVLRPLKIKYGPKIAFWSSYFFSGLLHELAISLPVNAGFGKPFAYFIIQAILIMVVEKHIVKTNRGNFIQKLWLLSCLFLPIFLLFHRQFIQGVVIPLINYLTIYS